MRDEDDSSIPPLVERGDSSCYSSDSSSKDSSNSTGSRMPRLVTRLESRAMLRGEQRSGRETPESLPDLASDSSIPDLIEYDFHRLFDRSLFRDAPQMNFQNNFIDMLGDLRMRMNVYYMDGIFDDSTYSASSIESDFDVEVEALLDNELEFRKMLIYMMIDNGFGENIDRLIDGLKKKFKKQGGSFEVQVNAWKGRDTLLEAVKDGFKKTRVLRNEKIKEKREKDIMKFVACYEEALEEIESLEGDSDSNSEDIYSDEEFESDKEVDSDNAELVSNKATFNSSDSSNDDASVSSLPPLVGYSSNDDASVSSLPPLVGYSSNDDVSISSLPPLVEYIPNQHDINPQNRQTRIHLDSPIFVPICSFECATELTTLAKNGLASNSKNKLWNCRMELIQEDMQHVLEKISVLQRKRVYLNDVQDFEKITLPELNTTNDVCYCKMVSKSVLAWILKGEVKQRIGLLMDNLLHSNKRELGRHDEQQDESQVIVAQKLVKDLTRFARFLDEDVLENRLIYVDEDGTSLDSTLSKLRTHARTLPGTYARNENLD